MLDSWALRVLVEVANRGSFSAAAEALSLTQPAVSRQVAGLERRLGTPLFRRVPRGVQTTPAGEVAAELAQDVLTRMQVLEARLRAFVGLDEGQVRISAFPSANTSFVPEAVHRFSQAHPGVTVSLAQPDPIGPLPAVRDGRVDVAVLTSWDLDIDPLAAKEGRAVALDGVDLLPLLDEELLVALPDAHRLTRHRRVPLRELRDATWIEGAHPDCLGPIPRLSEALGGPPRIGFVCDDWNGKQALVAAGLGVTLVPTVARSAMRRGVVLRPTSPALPTRRLYAAAAAPPFRLAAVTAMLTVLTDIAASRRAR